jgi:2'-5' RNA ligase
LTKGKSEIVTLAARVDAELAAAGFTPERRPYVPHLTLARVKQRPPSGFIRELLGRDLGADGAAGHFVPYGVSSFVLMEIGLRGRSSLRSAADLPLETACTPSK